MNEQQVWELSVAAAREIYRNLGHEVRTEISGLIDTIMQLKQQLVEQVLSAGSSELCRTCSGACCKHGKYHVSILDVLAYLATAADPVVPDFNKEPYCPYTDATGCLMAPGYRPVTCVIFNCDLIEDLLTPSGRDALHECEQKLREAVSRASRISASRLDRPVLLIVEQSPE